MKLIWARMDFTDSAYGFLELQLPNHEPINTNGTVLQSEGEILLS